MTMRSYPRARNEAGERRLTFLNGYNASSNFSLPPSNRDYWLEDKTLAEISRKVPSTAWGKELMTEAWSKRYPQLMSSNTYRGCAIVLSTLCTYMYTGITNPEILQIIQGVDQSVKTSTTIQSQSDLCSGAVLTITNAWTTAANLSFTTIISYNGGFWENTPLAQRRLHDWTYECMRRKGFQV